MRKTSNRQIQYNVENFDKIHASSASTQTAVNSKRTADLEQTIRQTSQQASLDRLRYSLAGEINHIINK